MFLKLNAVAVADSVATVVASRAVVEFRAVASQLLHQSRVAATAVLLHQFTQLQFRAVTHVLPLLHQFTRLRFRAVTPALLLLQPVLLLSLIHI